MINYQSFRPEHPGALFLQFRFPCRPRTVFNFSSAAELPLQGLQDNGRLGTVGRPHERYFFFFYFLLKKVWLREQSCSATMFASSNQLSRCTLIRTTVICAKLSLTATRYRTPVPITANHSCKRQQDLSGSLDRDELVQLCNKVGICPDEDVLSTLIDRCDEDFDGAHARCWIFPCRSVAVGFREVMVQV